LHAIAQCQKEGGVCAFIDAEHAFDIKYARSLGVQVEDLIFSQPDSAEEALDLVEELVNSGAVDMIIVDSVAALVPKAELAGDSGDQLPGLQARLMSQGLRKLTGIANKSHTTIVWINQIRYKIGVMFGSPETTAGGNSLKFYASIRIDVRRRGQLKSGEEVVANETEIKIIKNKTAPPYRTCEFQIEFGKGVNRVLDLLRIAVEEKVVDKSGAWYSFNGSRIGQGEANSVVYLRDNPVVLEEIERKLTGVEAKNGISTRDDDISGAT
jgi:recombination protein RecA